MSKLTGLVRSTLATRKRPVPTPNTHWKWRLHSRFASGTLDEYSANSTALDRLAKFDVFHSGGPFGGLNVANWMTALNGINSRRAAAGKPPIKMGCYVNGMEWYSRRIKSMTRSGTKLTIILDWQNGVGSSQALLTGSTKIRIFGSEEPLYNYDGTSNTEFVLDDLSAGSGGQQCMAQDGGSGGPSGSATLWRIVANLPSAAGANVSTSKATLIRHDQLSLTREVAQQLMANPGWTIPDWSDSDNPGDWGVWGEGYGTIGSNLFDSCPKVGGEDFGQWYSRRTCEVALQAIYDAGGLQLVFVDSFFNTPGEFWGDNNGWGDFLLTGSNVNSQSNDASGRNVRTRWRQGYKRVMQEWQLRMPGLLCFGNTSQATSGSTNTTDNDEYRGYTDHNYQERMVERTQSGSIQFQTAQNMINAIRPAMKDRRGLTIRGFALDEEVSTTQDIIWLMAVGAMCLVTTEDAPTIHPHFSNTINWSTGVTPWPAVLDVIWGEPVDPPLTTPSGISKGNGSSNDGLPIWRREFAHVMIVANGHASDAATCYPAVGQWQSYEGGGAIDASGIIIPAKTARLLLRV